MPIYYPSKNVIPCQLFRQQNSVYKRLDVVELANEMDRGNASEPGGGVMAEVCRQK